MTHFLLSLITKLTKNIIYSPFLFILTFCSFFNLPTNPSFCIYTSLVLLMLGSPNSLHVAKTSGYFALEFHYFSQQHRQAGLSLLVTQWSILFPFHQNFLAFFFFLIFVRAPSHFLLLAISLKFNLLRFGLGHGDTLYICIFFQIIPDFQSCISYLYT